MYLKVHPECLQYHKYTFHIQMWRPWCGLKSLDPDLQEQMHFVITKWSNSKQVWNGCQITENSSQWGGHGWVWNALIQFYNKNAFCNNKVVEFTTGLEWLPEHRKHAHHGSEKCTCGYMRTRAYAFARICGRTHVEHKKQRFQRNANQAQMTEQLVRFNVGVRISSNKNGISRRTQITSPQ